MKRSALSVAILVLAILAAFVPHAGAQMAFSGGGGGGGSGPSPSAPIPASWLVTSWYVDPVSGSDAATCTTSGAPCKTWQQILARLGTISPVLQGNTVVTFQNDQPDATDPVIWRPFSNGFTPSIYGGLVSAGTPGSLGTVTAKNRATPQLLTADLGQAATGLVGFILNDTTHPGRAWIDSASGNVATLTQPLAPATAVPPTIPSTFPAEVDTFAASDAYTLLRPVKVHVVDFRPVLTDKNALLGNLQQVWNVDPFGYGQSDVNYENIIVRESRVEEFITNTSLTTSSIYANIWSPGGGAFHDDFLVGGAYCTARFFACTSIGGDDIFDADVIFHYGFSTSYPLSGDIGIGFAYVDGTVDVLTGSTIQVSDKFYGGHALWGTGGVYANSGGGVFFTTSATAAMLTTGTLKLDNQTLGLSLVKSTGVFTGNITVNVANIDAAEGKSLFNPQTGSRFALYQP